MDTHPITTLAATIDTYLPVASYNPLSGGFNNSYIPKRSTEIENVKNNRQRNRLKYYC